MQPNDTASLPGRGIKPLVSLLAHRRLALVVFVIVLLAGAPVIYIKGQPMYATTATVQVAPRYMKNVRDDGELSFASNTQYREFLEHQRRSVLRYDIVEEALRSLDEKVTRPWRLPGESERLAIERLRTQIAARVIPDTYLIEISLQAKAPEGLADVVNAVVKVYIERMKTERIYGADVRLRNIETREAELVRNVEDKTAKRTELALQLGIGSFDEKVENPYDRVLNAQRSLLSEARNKRFEAEAKLRAFQTRGETDINLRSVQEAVLIDPGLASLKSNLHKRRAELLTQLAGLTPEHPAHQELSDEMRGIEAEIDSQYRALAQKVSRSVLARYQATVDQARQVEAALATDLAEQEKKGLLFSNLYNRAMTLTFDLEQERKELSLVRERLAELATEQNSFGFVRLVTPALPPELPFGLGKKRLALIVLAAALVASLAAPIAIDLLDNRMHTVNEVERVLGIPAMGWMVERANDATNIFAEDLLRRMAGRLIRERERHGTSVFAFSSVKPGAGSSEMVLSLARTLTVLGYRALAVEANAFRPDARLRGPQPDTPGLAQCLAGQADAMSCVVASENDLPARVWVGNTKGERHIDRLDRMSAVAQEWARDFQFVLVDIPPLLLSADAEILASNLQQLVLVVEAAAITRGELRRAGRQIEKLAPAAVGVVVNRVRTFEGGGYLRDLLVEHLSARKAAQYFSEPAWLLALRARLATLSTRSPSRPKFMRRSH